MNSPASSARSAETMPQPSRLAGLAVAGLVMAAAFAAGAATPSNMPMSEWAPKNRVVAAESGSPMPGKWSNDFAPELVEIMDALSLTDPSRRVVFKKARQVGGSECGLNLQGHVIDVIPAPILTVLPTLDLAQRYARIKLQPMIDKTESIRLKVAEQKSRDESGSTASFKRFPGGFLQLTGANTAIGLKMLTARVLILEECSEYPLDVDNQGDPVDIAIKTTTMWAGREKIFFCSTPGIKGICRASKEFEASDQRDRHVPCPHCGVFQALAFERLRYDEKDTADTWYECETGCRIEHRDKAGMRAKGIWVAKHPERTEIVGFHLNQLYSSTVTWAEIAADWLLAKGNPRAEKVFVNQVLALEYEVKGDAPDWQRLFERREAYPLGAVPPGGLVLVAGVDVQKDYLVYDVLALGVGKTSWSIDFGQIEGSTASHEVWRKLAAVLERRYVDARGAYWSIDMMAVDTGFLPQMAYAFIRGHSRVMAVKGLGGHLRPALGVATQQDISYQGVKRRRGIMLWPVGTWSLKAEFYANLRKSPPREGAEGFEPGYCHFSQQHPEGYFQQITAESLVTRLHQGREIQSWVKSGDNHYLDCRVYAMAAAERLGISAWSPRYWQQLIADRSAAPAEAQADLAALWAGPATVSQPAPAEPAAAAAETAEPASPFVAPAASPAPAQRRHVAGRRAIPSPFMG